jgi:putative cardiolipin synthase
MSGSRWTLWRAAKVLAWSLAGVFVGLPVLLYLGFLGIQEASERQWLGKAPTHPAIDVRSHEPHTVALLDVGFDSLATRMRLIEEARESIELEFFIYEVDTASRLVTQALARKAREGVKVRLLVDFALPVFKLAPRYAQALEAAGVEVRYYNTAGLARFFASNHRTHRKLLVVDRRKAIVGGRNIADDYFDLSERYNFLDSDMLIDGPVVAGITDSFELYWASDWVTNPIDVVASSQPVPGTELLGLPTPAEVALAAELQRHPPQHALSTCNDMHFVTDYPGSGVERRKVFLELTRLAKEARQQIMVESPYLVLRDDGLAVLQQVAQRGVKLQILTNSLYSTDAFYTVASLANSLDRLALPKLEVWAYGGQALAGSARPSASPRWGVHAKRAVFDDHTVVVGTYNIDPRSANLNSELMVVCRNNRFLAETLQHNMRLRIAQSRAVVGAANAGGYETLVEGADSDTLFKMRAIAPFASWLDFLM